MRKIYNVDEVFEKVQKVQGKSKSRIITYKTVQKAVKLRNKSYREMIQVNGGFPSYKGALVTFLKMFYCDNDCDCYRRTTSFYDNLHNGNFKKHHENIIFERGYVLNLASNDVYKIPTTVPEIIINDKNKIVLWFNEKINKSHLLQACLWNREYGKLVTEIVNEKDLMCQDKLFIVTDGKIKILQDNGLFGRVDENNQHIKYVLENDLHYSCSIHGLGVGENIDIFNLKDDNLPLEYKLYRVR